jgi:hypothetical protein
MFLEDFVDVILPGLPHNLLGVMDQLICSCAARFVGVCAWPSTHVLCFQASLVCVSYSCISSWSRDVV